MQLRGRIGEAPFAGKHRDRPVGVANQLVSAMGAARDDKHGRQDGVRRGFRPFDAPVRIIATHMFFGDHGSHPHPRSGGGGPRSGGGGG